MIRAENKSTNVNHDAMLRAAKEFTKKYPSCSENRAYKELSRMRDNASYIPAFPD
jgi:hypothetical protein